MLTHNQHDHTEPTDTDLKFRNNGTSTFAGVGTSIVDGVEVSSISLDKSQNQLSVTLSRTATQVQGCNNNITSTDTTIAASRLNKMIQKT